MHAGTATGKAAGAPAAASKPMGGSASAAAAAAPAAAESRKSGGSASAATNAVQSVAASETPGGCAGAVAGTWYESLRYECGAESAAARLRSQVVDDVCVPRTRQQSVEDVDAAIAKAMAAVGCIGAWREQSRWQVTYDGGAGCEYFTDGGSGGEGTKGGRAGGEPGTPTGFSGGTGGRGGA